MANKHNFSVIEGLKVKKIVGKLKIDCQMKVI
jgi:hypothetical protein